MGNFTLFCIMNKGVNAFIYFVFINSEKNFMFIISMLLSDDILMLINTYVL